MKVAIYGRTPISNVTAKAFQTLYENLTKAGVEILVFKPFLRDIEANQKLKLNAVQPFSGYSQLNKKVKFLFSLGGDGTLLETVKLIRNSDVPVIGINTGRLGFLSSISENEISYAVGALLNKKYSLDKRILIEFTIDGKKFGDCNYALNDVAILKTDSSSMITIHAYLNGKFLNSYWADGLVVATPTGSTAYSLSCGGPIVMPDSDSFIISPVAPHNLNVRPIIVSSDDVITLEAEGRSSNFLVSLDTHSEIVQPASKLTIKKANFTISLVKLESHDFLNTLRNKLMWGVDKRN